MEKGKYGVFLKALYNKMDESEYIKSSIILNDGVIFELNEY